MSKFSVPTPELQLARRAVKAEGQTSTIDALKQEKRGREESEAEVVVQGPTIAKSKAMNSDMSARKCEAW